MKGTSSRACIYKDIAMYYICTSTAVIFDCCMISFALYTESCFLLDAVQNSASTIL